MRVRDIVGWLEEFAPGRLAEPWDNVGLLWGDPESLVDRVMTCLTITAPVAAEAITGRADLILTHHPILFRPVQKVRADDRSQGFLWVLARAGVAVASPHTAFDNTRGGINDIVAGRLGLADVGPLRPGTSPSFKLVVFAPPDDREPVLRAAFDAGAGRIGDYDECSFTTAGRGTFLPLEGADPTLGAVGRREAVREWKLEVVCPKDRLAAVLAAVRSAHSYEEPAIDIIPLEPSGSGPGAGRLGRLPAPTTLADFAALAADRLEAPGTAYAGDPSRRVEVVAIACGAGDDFLGDAARASADLLLTGEARFHRALEAEALGIGLVLAGHHATERVGVNRLAELLIERFPDLEAWASRVERDPLRPVFGRPGNDNPRVGPGG